MNIKEEDELYPMTESFNTSSFYGNSNCDESEILSQIEDEIDQQEYRRIIEQLREDLSGIFRKFDTLVKNNEQSITNSEIIINVKKNSKNFKQINQDNIEDYLEQSINQSDLDVELSEINIQHKCNEDDKINKNMQILFNCCVYDIKYKYSISNKQFDHI